MKTTIDIREILEEKIGGTPTIPATICIGEVLEFMDAGDEHEIDIRALLAERQAIALVWEAGMLLEAYPHLARDQAWEALQQCERDHEAGQRLGWDRIAEVVDDRFPAAPEAKRRLLDGIDRLQRRVEALPARAEDDPSVYGELAAGLDGLEETLRTKGG